MTDGLQSILVRVIAIDEDIRAAIFTGQIYVEGSGLRQEIVQRLSRAVESLQASV